MGNQLIRSSSDKNKVPSRINKSHDFESANILNGREDKTKPLRSSSSFKQEANHNDENDITSSYLMSEQLQRYQKSSHQQDLTNAKINSINGNIIHLTVNNFMNASSNDTNSKINTFNMDQHQMHAPRNNQLSPQNHKQTSNKNAHKTSAGPG